MEIKRPNFVFLAVLCLLCACQRYDNGPDNADPTARSGKSENGAISLFGTDLSFPEVKEKLRGRDTKQIADAIMQMATMRHRMDVVDLLLAAWNGTRSKYPDLNWHLVEQQEVRVALAEVLGQWDSNPTYRAYILGILEKTPESEKTRILMALGAVATDQDIAYLEQVGRGDNDVDAAGALSGLQIAATEPSIAALERVRSDEAVPKERRDLAAAILALPRRSRDRAD